MPDSKRSPESENPQRPKKKFEEACKEKIDPGIWQMVIPLFKEDVGLFIFGTVGTGKTFLCHAIRKEYKSLRLEGRVEILQTNEVFLRIKGTFAKSYEGQSEQNIIDEISGRGDKWSDSDGIDVLILDDLGIEKPTEWAQETLYTIVDRRYRDNKKTVFTSNYSLDDLVERIGDRIPSRIAEMCKVIKLEGKDRRLGG